MLVSVLMPVFNCEKFIREAIESMLFQTYTQLEIIIIDDFSTDNTYLILQEYAQKYPKIKLFRNLENKGLIFSLNYGLSLVQGKYIARMDGDDVSMLNRIEIQMNYIQKNPNCEVLFTKVIIIDERGNVLNLPAIDENQTSFKEIYEMLPNKNFLYHPSVLICTNLLKKKSYNPLQYGIEDYDLWLRLVSDGVILHKIAEPLLKYRYLHNSLSSLNTAKKKGDRVYFEAHKIFLLGQIKRKKIGKIEWHVLKWFLWRGLKIVFGPFKRKINSIFSLKNKSIMGSDVRK